MVASGEGLVALHRCRFVDWSPSPAVAVAASSCGAMLAVVRENGEVEFWDVESCYCQQTFTVGSPGVVSCVDFLPTRPGKPLAAVVGSLEGTITLLTVGASQPTSVADSMGGAVWAVSAIAAPEDRRPGREGEDAPERDALVAVACDDGSSKVFEADVAAALLRYWRATPRIEGRALLRSHPAAPSRPQSVAWHPNARILVTGTSQGTLHACEARTQREVLRMTAGAPTRQGPASVWAVRVLPSGDVVCGDSSGAVRWFDRAMGTQIATLSVHQADVLAIATSRDGTAVLAAGADHQVALFRLVPAGDDSPPTWTYVTSKRPHTHDVRGMTLVPSKEGPEEDLVATCAEDSQVVLFSVAQFEKQHPSKLTAMPSAPALSVSPSASALLARHHDRVDVWGMPECAAPGKGATEGQLLTPDAAPVLLKRIRPDALAGPLCAAAASPDGAWVAVSDRRATRAFLATDAGDVGVDDRSLPPASALSFVGESRLALAGSSGGLWVYDMAGDEESEGGEGQPSGTPKQLLSVKSCDGPIHVLERDGDLLLACSRRRAWVFDVRKGELVASVPSPQGPITCGAVRHKQGIVLLASATNDVVLFDAFKQKRIACPALETGVVSERLATMPGAVRYACLHPSIKGLAILGTPTAFCIVHLLRQGPQAPSKKRKRTAEYRPPDLLGGPRENGRVLVLEHPCLFLGFETGGALVMVEKPWAEVLASLPAPVVRRTFGN